MPNTPNEASGPDRTGLAAQLAIAGFRQVYSTGRVGAALEELP